jgi:putative DNA primase/helicase
MSREAEDPQPEDIFGAVKRLAALRPLEYEKVRAAEAKRLGVRAGALDKAVSGTRTERQQGAGKAAMFPEVEPWPDPVDLAALLDEIRDTIRRFIICDSSTAIAATLWAAFTWCINHVQVAPLLVITAPEMKCGKSQLLDVVGRLSCHPLVASNISAPAVFRVIEAHCPTLLIDEADSFMKDNEELRGVLNSGHTRQSAYVIRTVGDDHEPRQFSTWGAKAISGIGHLAGTLMDRAIVLPLRRKLSTEKCSRLRHTDPGTFTRLASMLARFAEDAGPSIGQARPNLPEELNDRAQDNWEPLLAIADLAGGEWPTLSRAAALNLSGSEHEPVSTATELLSDIQEIFTIKKVEQIATAELLTALIADDLKPWGSYSYGKPITPRQLSKRLNEFGIGSRNIKFHDSGNVVLKGYQLDQFKDVFERYLAPSTLSNSPLPATFDPESSCGAVLHGSGLVAVADSSATDPRQVADENAARYQSATPKPAPLLAVAVVADSEGVSRAGDALALLPLVSGDTIEVDL